MFTFAFVTKTDNENISKHSRTSRGHSWKF